jgi:hypothetical protein
MNKTYPYSEIQRLVGPSQNILIYLPKNVSLDQAAAGLSLSLTLVKSGKKVQVVCPDLMTVGFSHLVGVDKVTDKLGGGNLVLKINAPLAGIDKISTTDDGQNLSLVIITKEGNPPLTPEQIIFENAVVNYDLIITCGLRKFEGLGKIYTDNSDLFAQKPIINIDNNTQNAGFGRLNIIDPQTLSLSEMVLAIILGLGLALDEDTGSNLLQGIKMATNNFEEGKVTADTFEAASVCLRTTPQVQSVAPAEAMPQEKTEDLNPPAPTDWAEPKIYKGSTIS